MSLLDAYKKHSPANDSLMAELARLPHSEPEETPGRDWSLLREALRLDETHGALLVSTIRDRRFGATEKDPSWRRIANLSAQGHSVYFGLSKVPGDWAPSKETGFRGTAKTCQPRDFIGVDFDLNYGVHSAGGISLDDAMKAIARFPARPVAVVSSGGGLHVYYRFEKALDAVELLRVGDRVNGFFGQATDPGPWDAKPTIDLARILRIPGTLNRKGDESMWVRLIHVDADAAPLTEAMIEPMPTLAAVKRAHERGTAAPRPARDIPKVRRTFNGTPPWEAFNRVFNEDEDLFADFIERLGGHVAGRQACMPGYADWEDPNSQYSGSIYEGDEDLVVTIHSPSVADFWACGSSRQTFAAFDLLAATFDGDRSATARYVKRVVLDDVEGWLRGFRWEPGDPAPTGETPTRRSAPIIAPPTPPAKPVTPALGVVKAPEPVQPAPTARVLRPVPTPEPTETDRAGQSCDDCGIPFSRTVSGAWLCDVCEDF